MRIIALAILFTAVSTHSYAQWAEIQRLPNQSQDSDNGGSPLYNGGPDVVIAPNGDILVFYTQNGAFTNFPDGTPGEIKMMRSSDNGTSWVEPVVLFTDRNSEPQGLGPPLVAVNPVSGRITLMFFNQSGSAPSFETGDDAWNSDDNGETWTKAGVNTVYALSGFSLEYGPGGTLIYSYLRNGATGEELVFATSSDDGATWSTPSRITTTPEGELLCEHALSALSENEWLVHSSNCWFGPGGTTTLTEFRTSDGGETWSDPSEALTRGSGFFSSTELLLASDGTLWEVYTDGSDQLYRTSSDDGATWSEPVQFTGGEKDGNIECSDAAGGPICVFLTMQRADDPDLQEIFAGQLGVSKDPLLVVANEDVGDVPASFSLLQNYPNPFNPSTTISFELGSAQDVRLTLHDALGRQVTELAAGPRAAGRHELSVDASDLPSGVYVYRLQTDEGVSSRFMTVTK